MLGVQATGTTTTSAGLRFVALWVPEVGARKVAAELTT